MKHIKMKDVRLQLRVKKCERGNLRLSPCELLRWLQFVSATWQIGIPTHNTPPFV
jgi:hypothetical protein